MIEWTRISGFDWDEGNERKSIQKHGVSQVEAEQIFFNQPLLILPDEKHSHSEQKFHTLGRTDTDRLLHITFTLRANNSLIRIISARDMHRKEKLIYEQT